MTDPADGSAAERPIAELRNLEMKPRAGFLDRVKQRVERRRLAADTVDLSLSSVRLLFWQFLELVFDALGSRRGEDGEGR